MDGDMPSSTIFCCPNESKSQSNIEVLNVNNVDSTGCIVLNDEKLLELVQLYPFLYNPRVRPFQDADYDDWAWSRITASFNQNYTGLLTRVHFDKTDLQRRWEKLKPIIKKMAKMLDLTAIPEPLRQIIVKISIQLEDQKTDVRINVPTAAQQIVYDNMAMVANLPLDIRLQLEAEMMDLILNSELDTKATIKLNEMSCAAANDEYEDLLNEMDFKELLVLKTTKDNSPQEQLVTSTTTNGNGSMIYDMFLNGCESSSDMFTNSHSYTFSRNNKRRKYTDTAIPLNDAHKYVKRCVVRVKRINFEDYLPLAYLTEMRSRRRKSSSR